MTIKYYISRPSISITVQWDGSNASEVAELFGTDNVLDVDSDGVLTVFDPSCGEYTVNPGQWVAANWGQGLDANPYQASSTELDGPGPYDYATQPVTP